MFLIFGLRVYFRTIGQGMFHCQRCGGDRRYRERAGRRWFHLFFIPLIPLVSVGEQVMCGTCRTAYNVGVLALPTAAQMQAALPAGLRAAAAAMLRAGGPGRLAARRRAIEAVRARGLPGYDDAALDGDLAAPAGQDEDLADSLNRLALQLAVHAREWFLADVVRIGLADGPLSEKERHAARQIAANLGMTVAQAHGVISMTEESATAE
jgi:hypothetical protein